ncbi:MAG: hypothetical protein ACPGJV_12700 [Bacteriovoracaceae bacterium]
MNPPSTYATQGDQFGASDQLQGHGLQDDLSSPEVGATFSTPGSLFAEVEGTIFGFDTIKPECPQSEQLNFQKECETRVNRQFKSPRSFVGVSSELSREDKVNACISGKKESCSNRVLEEQRRLQLESPSFTGEHSSSFDSSCCINGVCNNPFQTVSNFVSSFNYYGTENLSCDQVYKKAKRMSNEDDADYMYSQYCDCKVKPLLASDNKTNLEREKFIASFNTKARAERSQQVYGRSNPNPVCEAWKDAQYMQMGIRLYNVITNKSQSLNKLLTLIRMKPGLVTDANKERVLSCLVPSSVGDIHSSHQKAMARLGKDSSMACSQDEIKQNMSTMIGLVESIAKEVKRKNPEDMKYDLSKLNQAQNVDSFMSTVHQSFMGVVDPENKLASLPVSQRNEAVLNMLTSIQGPSLNASLTEEEFNLVSRYFDKERDPLIELSEDKSLDEIFEGELYKNTTIRQFRKFRSLNNGDLEQTKKDLYGLALTLDNNAGIDKFYNKYVKLHKAKEDKKPDYAALEKRPELLAKLKQLVKFSNPSSHAETPEELIAQFYDQVVEPFENKGLKKVAHADLNKVIDQDIMEIDSLLDGCDVSHLEGANLCNALRNDDFPISPVASDAKFIEDLFDELPETLQSEFTGLLGDSENKKVLICLQSQGDPENLKAIKDKLIGKDCKPTKQGLDTFISDFGSEISQAAQAVNPISPDSGSAGNVHSRLANRAVDWISPGRSGSEFRESYDSSLPSVSSRARSGNNSLAAYADDPRLEKPGIIGMNNTDPRTVLNGQDIYGQQTVPLNSGNNGATTGANIFGASGVGTTTNQITRDYKRFDERRFEQEFGGDIENIDQESVQAMENSELKELIALLKGQMNDMKGEGDDRFRAQQQKITELERQLQEKRDNAVAKESGGSRSLAGENIYTGGGAIASGPGVTAKVAAKTPTGGSSGSFASVPSGGGVTGVSAGSGARTSSGKSGSSLTLTAGAGSAGRSLLFQTSDAKVYQKGTSFLAEIYQDGKWLTFEISDPELQAKLKNNEELSADEIAKIAESSELYTDENAARKPASVVESADEIEIVPTKKFKSYKDLQREVSGDVHVETIEGDGIVEKTLNGF